jgi:hypothetical protein
VCWIRQGGEWTAASTLPLVCWIRQGGAWTAASTLPLVCWIRQGGEWTASTLPLVVSASASIADVYALFLLQSALVTLLGAL